LLAALAGLRPKTAALLSADSHLAQPLADYWRARDLYLQLGVQTLGIPQSRDLIAELAPQLVGIVRLSAEFDSAYRPVLAMADELARSDPSAARRLLQSLHEANPTRPEANQKLQVLKSER
jgi:spermidine synthase